MPPVAVYGRATLVMWIVAFAAFFVPEGIAVLALSRRYPGEGGVYLWARRHFGDLHGFVSGWCYWTNNLFYVPVLLVYLAGVVAFVGGEHTAPLVNNRWYVATVAFGWLAIITVANVRGMGVGKWINNAGGVGSAVTVVLLVDRGRRGAVAGRGRDAADGGRLGARHGERSGRDVLRLHRHRAGVDDGRRDPESRARHSPRHRDHRGRSPSSRICW